MQIETISVWDLSALNSNQSPGSIQLTSSLPVGWQDRHCPICSGEVLRAALITPSADEQDPDVICTSCGSYF